MSIVDRYLAYADAFAPTGPVLQWLSGICILATINGHFRFGLIASGRQLDVTIATGIGTAVGLGCLPLGYRELGLTGAAMALLLGEVAVSLSAWMFSRRSLGLYKPFRHLIRPGVSSVVIWMILPKAMPFPGKIAIAAVGLAGFAYASDSRVRGMIRKLGEV